MRDGEGQRERERGGIQFFFLTNLDLYCGLLSLSFSLSLVWPLLLGQGSSCLCLKDHPGVFARFIPCNTHYACFPLPLVPFVKNTIAVSFEEALHSHWAL